VGLGTLVDRLENPVVSRRLDDLLTTLGIGTVPVTGEQAEVGRAAY